MIPVSKTATPSRVGRWLKNIGLGLFLVLIVFFAGYAAILKSKLWFISDQRVVLVSQQTYPPKSQAALRVFVQNEETGEAVSDATVNVSLENKEGKELSKLFSGKTDPTGSVGGSFQVPSVIDGEYFFHAFVYSKLGKDDLKKSFVVATVPRILVTTDRTLYKPGQSLNWRALVINKHDLKPQASAAATVSIYDGDKNLIFKQIYTTSPYGIVGDVFPFATELNTGEFKLAVSVKDVFEEKVITVSPFVLPKFSVQIEPDKSYFDTNEDITGVLKASYFFGEPVKNGDVHVFIGKTEVFGKTNSEGTFPFRMKSPGWAEGVTAAAEVTDSSKNLVKAETSIPVSSRDGLKIELVAEAGEIKPHLDNELFVLATYPDGAPAQVTMRLGGGKTGDLATNEFGVTSFIYNTDTAGPVMPADTSPRSNNPRKISFTIVAGGSQENQPEVIKMFEVPLATNQIGHLLIHPDNVLLDSPRDVNLQIQSTEKQGVVFVDLVQNGKFIATYAANTSNGSGTLKLPLIQDTIGTLELLAYQRIPRQEYVREQDGKTLYRIDYVTIRDNKLVYVNGKKGLVVGIDTDKSEYKPGGEAVINFDLKNEDGGFENGAIGVKVVDEAMLALEKGTTDEFEKLYVLLEKGLQQESLNGKSLAEHLQGEFNETKALITREIFAGTPVLTTDFNIEETQHGQQRAQLSGKFVLISHILSIFVFFMAMALLVKVFSRSRAQVKEKFVVLKTIVVGLGLHIAALIPATIVIFKGQKYLQRYHSFEDSIEEFFEALGEVYEKMMDAWQSFSGSWWFAVLLILLFVVLFFWLKRTSAQDGARFRSIIRLSLIVIALMVLGNVITSNDEPYVLSRELVVASNNVLVIALILSGACISQFLGKRYLYWMFTGLFGLSLFFIPGTVAIATLVVGIVVIAHVDMQNSDFELLEQIINERLKNVKGRGADMENYFLMNKLMGLKKKRKYIRRGKRLVVAGTTGLIVSVVMFAVLNTVMLGGGTGDFDGYGDFERSEIRRGGGGGGGGFGMISSNDYPENISSATSSESSSFSFKELLPSQPSPQEIAQTKPFDLGLEKQEISQQEKATYVRKLFPEVMYFNPAIIAENGKAKLTLSVKDSITTWRLSALASSLNGFIGSSSSILKVFQDFFLDFELPSQLTVGDEIEFPVTLFNYTDKTLSLQLKAETQGSINLVSKADLSKQVGAKSQTVVSYRIKAVSPGAASIRVDAISDNASDAVEKKTIVNPDGKVLRVVVASEKLGKRANPQVIFPAETIPGTEKIILKLYPSYFSQVVEGLESILQFPSGCFEQTSSSLYPDILVLNYLRKTKLSSPEIEKKALEHIKAGFQKILSYEVKAERGGFSLYGDEPAEVVLTAYGFMEFNDLKDVYTVDPDLLARMENFLFNKQKGDGSFNLSGSHSGGLSKHDELSKNAYIIWALSHAIDSRDAKFKRLLKPSLDYLKNHLPESYEDSYTLALVTNALVNAAPNDQATQTALKELLRQAQKEDGMIYFSMKYPNYYGSHGIPGNIEATALAAIAFLKSGGDYQQPAYQALNYLIAKKDPNSSWHSTQATILALKALVTATETAQASNKEGNVTLQLNSLEQQNTEITPENSLVVQLFSWDAKVQRENTITLEQDGDLSVVYELVKEYAVPWNQVKEEQKKNLYVSQTYVIKDAKSSFSVNDLFSISTFVKNTGTTKKANVLVRLPIPAGFTTVDAIKEIQEAKQSVKKAELYDDAVLVYIQNIDPGQEISFNHSLRAKFPAVVKASPASAYDYYNPFDEDFGDGRQLITK